MAHHGRSSAVLHQIWRVHVRALACGWHAIPSIVWLWYIILVVIIHGWNQVVGIWCILKLARPCMPHHVFLIFCQTANPSPHGHLVVKHSILTHVWRSLIEVLNPIVIFTLKVVTAFLHGVTNLVTSVTPLPLNVLIAVS